MPRRNRNAGHVSRWTNKTTEPAAWTPRPMSYEAMARDLVHRGLRSVRILEAPLHPHRKEGERDA